MKKYIRGFTLVELIVVIVILGILATVWFVSYNGYLGWARDGNRVTQLKNINDSLQLYSTNKDLPFPDDYVTIEVNSEVVGYQWYAGENTLEIINYTSGGKDPKDNVYYTYFLSSDKKRVQLLTFLEEADNLQTHAPLRLFDSAHAADYSNRLPKVYGKKLGVLTQQTTNTPVQEIATIQSAGLLDVGSASSDTYTAHLSDGEKITSVTGGALTNMSGNASCKRLKEVGVSSGDGEYTVNPTGSSEFSVYCNMSTGGGWWTHIGSKIGTGNNTNGDLGVVATKPGTAANVTISQTNFRDDLTEAMACSTANCWVWDLNTAFKGCLQNSCTDTTGQTVTVKRVSGSSGFQNITATSFWYNWDGSSLSAMFNITDGSDGAGATTNRWDMDGWTQNSWGTGDQWDIYVR